MCVCVCVCVCGNNEETRKGSVRYLPQVCQTKNVSFFVCLCLCDLFLIHSASLCKVPVKCFGYHAGHQGTSTIHTFSMVLSYEFALALGLSPFKFLTQASYGQRCGHPPGMSRFIELNYHNASNSITFSENDNANVRKVIQ